MEYLTVGRSELKKEAFVPVKDRALTESNTRIYKPTGGIWFTKYDARYPGYNDWVDYLINNPQVLFYKNINRDLWHHPCSIVTLEANANIFNLDDLDKYAYLTNKFMLDKGMFSYEKMSEVYDGIYVDVRKLLCVKDKNMSQLVMQYAVDTLLLFNLNPIDYYYSGMVSIDPFDLESYMYNEGGYLITHDNVKRRIK